MMVRKKGITPAVTIFLIILVTVAAVAVFWSLLLPVINEGFAVSSEDINLEIVTDAGYTYYDSEDEILSVQVRRGSDSVGDIYFKLIVGFEDGNSLTSPAVFLAPAKDSSRTYEVGLKGYGVPVSVNLVSVLEDGSYTSPAYFTGGYDIPLVEGDSDTPYSNVLFFNGTNGTVNETQNIIPISGCGILNVTDAVYVLNRSVYTTGSCFVIGADNIVIDLNGKSITGDAYNGDDYGISSDGYDGVTIKNGFITNFGSGIVSIGGNGWNIINVSITADGWFVGKEYCDEDDCKDECYGVCYDNCDCDGYNICERNCEDPCYHNCEVFCDRCDDDYFERNVKVYGMYLDGLKNSFVTGNSMSNVIHRGMEGLIYGMYLNGGSGNTIQDNVVSDNWLGGYERNSDGDDPDEDYPDDDDEPNTNGYAYGMYIRRGSENIIQNNIINNNDAENGVWGMYLDDSSENIIQENQITRQGSDNVGYGMYLINSDHNDLISNDLSDNHIRGVSFFGSDYNDFIGNTVNHNRDDEQIHFSYSDYNYLADNTLEHEDEGILFESSSYNTLAYNAISEGDNYLVRFEDGSEHNDVYCIDFLGGYDEDECDEADYDRGRCDYGNLDGFTGSNIYYGLWSDIENLEELISGANFVDYECTSYSDWDWV